MASSAACLWVWCRRTNRRPCCLSMSNPSSSRWTAWPDGAGRWDNWMAAQYLSRDLVWSSSGYNNSLKRRTAYTKQSVEKMLFTSSTRESRAKQIYRMNAVFFLITGSGGQHNSKNRAFVASRLHLPDNPQSSIRQFLVPRSLAWLHLVSGETFYLPWCTCSAFLDQCETTESANMCFFRIFAWCL